jgi:hypothetical protein
VGRSVFGDLDFPCGAENAEKIATSKLTFEKTPTEAAFADLSKIDHTPITEKGHTRIMVAESKTLTREEFASLLRVGNTFRCE